MALVDAFITFEEYAEYRNLTDADRVNVRSYEPIIQGVTSWIEQKTGRRFLLKDVLVSANNFTERYNGTELTSILYPKNWPVTSVVSLHDDINLPPTFTGDSELTEDDQFVVSGIEQNMVQLIGFNFANGIQNVQLVYQAGYDPKKAERNGGLPESVKLLALIMTSFFVNQIGIENIASETVGRLGERTKSFRGSIPKDAQEILSFLMNRDL